METSSQFLPPAIEAGVAAIRRSLTQAAAGQTREADMAFDKFEAR
jgi:hypothetical protein